MSKIFFISDTHFGHANMIKFENRPFSSTIDMDNTMISNWNSKVSPNDSVYILGDFSWGDKDYTVNILSQLNGKKYLIKGNHDYIKDREIASQFEWIKDYFMLRHNGLKFVLFHYPIQVWDCKHYGSIHLYGHVHSNRDNTHPYLDKLGYAYNVGADVNNFTPIELNEILVKLKYKGV